MPKHEHLFLDSESLKQVLRRIKDHYSTKAELEQERTERESAESTLLQEVTGLLETETSAREEADASLHSDIETEASTRETADTELLSSINSEISDREQSDIALQSNIDSEATSREQADIALQSNIDAIYKSENGVETGVLIDKLDSQRSYVDTQISNISGALNNLTEDYNTSKEEIGQFVDEATSGLNSLRTRTNNLDTALHSEIVNREQAEEYITARLDSFEGLIDAEVINRELADDELREYIEEKAFAFNFKGYVQDFEDLPTEDLSKGDMYCVVNACEVGGVHYTAGTNFVWEGHNWFAQSSVIDLSNYYNKTEINSLLNTKVGYAVVDEETHELVLKATESSVSEIARISGIGGGGGGGEGPDPELRAEFEAHLASDDPHPSLTSLINAKASKGEVNDLANSLEGHLESQNAHTPAQVGLGNVSNLAPADLPISTATQSALDLKADKTELQEGLSSKADATEIDRVEYIIDGVQATVASLGRALSFKGLVATIGEIENIQNPTVGDCYQIVSDIDETVTDKSHDGEMYAYTDNGWVKIVSSAQDLSSLIATPAEINDIIENYT